MHHVHYIYNTFDLLSTLSDLRRGYVVDITSTNAKNFTFPQNTTFDMDGFPSHITVGEKGIGIQEMGEALVHSGADRAQVTPAWLQNHYRLYIFSELFFVLFYFVLFCFVLFCFVLFCFVLFCFVLFVLL